MLYYKANSNRRNDFQTYVSILENDRVSKGALVTDAYRHIDSIYDNAKKLAKISDHFDLNYTLDGHVVSCDLVKGTSLSEILVTDLIHQDYEQMNEKINEFFQTMEELLPHCAYEKQDSLFGEGIDDPTLVYTNVANLDFNFDNVFILENDFKVIDCEWCFDTIIPIDFLKYRSLLYFYSKYSSLFKEYMSYENWLALFHISHIDVYQLFEDTFQQYVYGANRKNNLVSKWFDENRRLKDITPKEPFAQLYIDEGNGFSEANSICKNIEDYHLTLSFDLNKNIHALRFDLCNFASYIQVNEIRLVMKEGIQKVDLSSTSSNGYTDVKHFVYLHDDPQLHISNIDLEVERFEVDYIIVCDSTSLDFIPLTHQLLENKQREIQEKMNSLQHELDVARYQASHPIRTFVKKGLK